MRPVETSYAIRWDLTPGRNRPKEYMTYGDINLPYAIDLDNTLAVSIWPKRGIGKPIQENLPKIRAIASAGHQIAIHTARPWSDYPLIEEWLIKHDIPFDNIVCGKYLAYAYCDDKSINADEPTWIRVDSETKDYEREMYWAAGLFEGEGCIYISKPNHNGRRRVTMTVCMCDEDVVRRFADLVGVNVSTKEYNSRLRPNWNTAYQCQIGKEEKIKELLIEWIPMFGDRRREKALKALDVIASNANIALLKKRTEKHGSYGEYSNYGCRCEPCKNAGREYLAAWHLRHKERRNAAARERYLRNKALTPKKRERLNASV